MKTMRLRVSTIYYIWALLLLGLGSILPACSGGDDFMPNYFPHAEDEAAGSVTAPPTTLSSAACTIKFSSTLCVVLKRGTDVSFGAEGQEKICAEDLPAIPIRIEGSKATLHGEEFPDLVVSGHGLPAAMTINGKGSTDGKDNIGEGAVDAAGNITLKNFTVFASIFGTVFKIPNITFTTGVATGSKDLPDMHGVPASGSNMTLVSSTIMGSMSPTADKYFLGTTLQITLKGTVAPKLSECSGAGSSLPTTIQVTKITTDDQKRQHEQLIPNGTQMEVAGNILIPESAADVGSQFEGSSRFRIRNISKQSIPLQIPPIVGAFQIKPETGDLTAALPSQQSIVVHVSFRPPAKSASGTFQESLSIGSDYFTLVGLAEKQRGITSIHTIDDTGTISTGGTDTVLFADIPVSALTQQAYFQCETLTCNDVTLPTRCQPCIDVASGKCQLLSADNTGLATGEVDDQCNLLRPKAKESQGINLQNGTSSESRTIVIHNDGTKPLTITSLSIADIAKSHSTHQFQVNPTTVYQGTNAAAVGTTPVTLPVTLQPNSDQKLFVVVTYSPTDLVGTDDAQVGTTATDQALLVVHTESVEKKDQLRIKLRGSTTIQESPPLQIFFKTSTGAKMRDNDSTFPLKGLIQTTQNAAVPVYAKLAEAAHRPLRITNVEITGGDTDHFTWLDTADKISAIADPERCVVSAAPVALRPNGFDVAPQAYTIENMPLLGCINFHQDPATAKANKVKFDTDLVITAVELDAKKQPIKRADGTLAESKITIHILATLHPRTGHQVFRVVQTMAILMISQSPTVASASSADELEILIRSGLAVESDHFLFLGSIVLDPFDEMTIKNEDGSIASTPDDGITSVFRAIDTHPTSFEGSDVLSPYTSLIYDGTALDGSRGVFFDKEYKAPDNFQTSGLRIYTSALSWPGPLAEPEKIPNQLTDCQQIDPCAHPEQLGSPPTVPGKKGVCAFFYVSAADWKSPGMHAKDSKWPDGTRENLCKAKDQKQTLNTLKGQYLLDGRLEYEDNGMRFWGPTYLHNPAGPVDRKPAALDEVFHITFSTDVLVPKEEGGKYNYVPEERTDHAKQEYKVNLNEKGATSICANNTNNKVIGDKRYSSWKYFAPFLVQDKEGKIPAGCPEEGNTFTGGRAYLRGRPLDPITGVVSVVAATKFGNDEDLTSVFKDVPIYVVLNGWLCDPSGSEAEGEGSLCYSQKFTPRDATATISIMKDGK